VIVRDFWQTLTRRPGPPTWLSRYTVANGLFYLPVGLVFLAWPDVLSQVGAPPLVGQEAGLGSALGTTLSIIGWFYIMGGRTNADSFGLATAVDRTIVPFVLGTLWATGQIHGTLALPFAILDPLLGFGAVAVWAWERRLPKRAASKPLNDGSTG